MKGIRALVSAALAALTLVALAVPATAAPGDLEQNIVVQGNAVYLRTKYTPDPKLPWDRVGVDYKVIYIKGGTGKPVLARQGEMNVYNNDTYKQEDGTYEVLTNAFIVLGPGDRIEVEFTYRAILDKNEKILATYKDTELQYTHPGQPTSQLGTPCLNDCLAQLSQGSDAGGGQLGDQQAAVVADSAELVATATAATEPTTASADTLDQPRPGATLQPRAI
jgi:hypothetical protein